MLTLSIGCSKANQPSDPATTTVTQTKTTPPNLDSWVGNYTFSEFASPNQNMFYEISIYNEDNNYYAKISIDGFQTMSRLQTKVLGDVSTIKLLFYKYLPDNSLEPYNEGNTLLSFTKKNSDIYTSWGKIQPVLDSNTKPDEIYFKIDQP